jgi:hypothetical protein
MRLKRFIAQAMTLVILLATPLDALAQKGGGRSSGGGFSSGRSSSGGGFSSGRSSGGFSSGKSSSGSGFKSSGGGFSSGKSSSGGGKSSSGFSSGSKSSSGSSGGSAGKSTGGFSSGSKSTPVSPGGSSSKSTGGFSSGSDSSRTTTTPLPGKTPKSVSERPVAGSFDSLARTDSVKAASRASYQKSTAPAPSYKTPAGKEVKIDPQDRQSSYLRGRLDESRWQNRYSRETSFYSTWSSRPVLIYNDPYHSFFNYWLLSQTLDNMSMMVYHHQMTMDSARLQALYAQNAGLQAKVAALEAQKVARDPTYTPTGVDPDLLYNDGYVNAIYNPAPKMVKHYEYGPDGVGFWTVMKWIFYTVLICVAAWVIVYLLFIKRFSI